MDNVRMALGERGMEQGRHNALDGSRWGLIVRSE